MIVRLPVGVPGALAGWRSVAGSPSRRARPARKRAPGGRARRASPAAARRSAEPDPSWSIPFGLWRRRRYWSSPSACWGGRPGAATLAGVASACACVLGLDRVQRRRHLARIHAVFAPPGVHAGSDRAEMRRGGRAPSARTCRCLTALDETFSIQSLIHRTGGGAFDPRRLSELPQSRQPAPGGRRPSRITTRSAQPSCTPKGTSAFRSIEGPMPVTVSSPGIPEQYRREGPGIGSTSELVQCADGDPETRCLLRPRRRRPPSRAALAPGARPDRGALRDGDPHRTDDGLGLVSAISVRGASLCPSSCSRCAWCWFPLLALDGARSVPRPGSAGGQASSRSLGPWTASAGSSCLAAIREIGPSITEAVVVGVSAKAVHCDPGARKGAARSSTLCRSWGSTPSRTASSR